VQDAVVVGSGPNGLAAAIALARAGRSVLVVEARDTVGGGVRSEELTLPGFLHDTCSAIHPLAVGSPFFRTVPLGEHGVEWINSPSPLAHPLDDGTAVMLERSLEETAAGLGVDGAAWTKLMLPLMADAEDLLEGILGPPLRPPRHPLTMARFGLRGLRSASGLARSAFDGERARALLAGNSAHAMLPLESAATASYGLVIAMLGHTVGWPVPRGGSQSISNALVSYLRSLGGEVETGRRVESLRELEGFRTVMLDISPRGFLALAGDRLSGRYRRSLERFRYGSGVLKVDYALSGPMPWRAPECTRAATLHLGGTLEEIAAAEATVVRGGHPDRPYVLVAQQSLFDPTRAPAGRHTLWTYCHVPAGSTVDMTERIEAQVERFAPGFRDVVIARHVMGPAAIEAHNPNYHGGDITAGVTDWRQFAARPVPSLRPWKTPVDGLYLCSASTPPGAGVHGMCGLHAARLALKRF
jgi:phytoene dehydrogenase-like protein